MTWFVPAALLPLLIGLPLGGAVVCLALRARPWLATALAASIGALTLAAWLAAPEIEVTLLGLAYRLDPPRRLAGVALVGGVLALLWLDRLVGRGRKFAAVSLTVAGTGAGVLLVQDVRAGAVLLLGASAAALFALLDQPLTAAGADRGLGAFPILPRPAAAGAALPPPPALAAALKYLALMVLAAVAFIVAFVLLDRYRLEPEQDVRLRLVLGFLAVGLGLRLGVAPLHAWVTDLCAATPPAAALLVLGLINTITVFFAAQVLAGAPMIVLANPLGRDLLLGGSALGVILAGVLAWSPAVHSDLRRLVGVALIGQVGFTLFGLASGSRAGFGGSVTGTVAAQGGALLALGAAGLIADRLGTADPAALPGLGRRAPGVTLALLVGLGLLLGAPPLAGFAGRVLVFQAAAQQGPGWPWVAALGVGLAGLAGGIVRALVPLWTRQPDASRAIPAPSRSAHVWFGVLALLALAGGLYPAPLIALAAQWAGGIAYLISP
jgi:NADH:ubiquinone oxidoreductase subunit 4 (subunit M)